MVKITLLSIVLLGCGSKEEADGASTAGKSGTGGAAGGASKTASVEAPMVLKKLTAGLNVVALETKALPTGSIPLTPATPCCENADKTCAAKEGDWIGEPLWVAMDFSLSEPHRFRYAYESDGKTFTARAVGDLDCDGTTIEYIATGSMGANGTVTSTIKEPAPNSD